MTTEAIGRLEEALDRLEEATVRGNIHDIVLRWELSTVEAGLKEAVRRFPEVSEKTTVVDVYLTKRKDGWPILGFTLQPDVPKSVARDSYIVAHLSLPIYSGGSFDRDRGWIVASVGRRGPDVEVAISVREDGRTIAKAIADTVLKLLKQV